MSAFFFEGIVCCNAKATVYFKQLLYYVQSSNGKRLNPFAVFARSIIVSGGPTVSLIVFITNDSHSISQPVIHYCI